MYSSFHGVPDAFGDKPEYYSGGPPPAAPPLYERRGSLTDRTRSGSFSTASSSAAGTHSSYDSSGGGGFDSGAGGYDGPLGGALPAQASSLPMPPGAGLPGGGYQGAANSSYSAGDYGGAGVARRRSFVVGGPGDPGRGCGMRSGSFAEVPGDAADGSGGEFWAVTASSTNQQAEVARQQFK